VIQWSQLNKKGDRMSNYNIIKFMLENMDTSQKDIADKIKVTPVMVSRWKRGSKIPREHETELMKMAGIWWDEDDVSSKWSIIVQTKENELKWYEYIEEFSIGGFGGDSEKKMQEILITMFNAGVDLPPCPPALLDPIFHHEWFETFIQDLIRQYLKYYSQWTTWHTQTFDSYAPSFHPFDENFADAFANLIPRLALFQQSVECVTMFFPGTNSVMLNRLEADTRHDFLTTVYRYCRNEHEKGSPVNSRYFESLIEFEPERDVFLDESAPKDSGNMDDFTIDTGSGGDQYMSKAEREIIKKIQTNESMLKEILNILKIEKLGEQS